MCVVIQAQNIYLISHVDLFSFRERFKRHQIQFQLGLHRLLLSKLILFVHRKEDSDTYNSKICVEVEISYLQSLTMWFFLNGLIVV